MAPAAHAARPGAPRGRRIEARHRHDIVRRHGQRVSQSVSKSAFADALAATDEARPESRNMPAST